MVDERAAPETAGPTACVDATEPERESPSSVESAARDAGDGLL